MRDPPAVILDPDPRRPHRDAPPPRAGARGAQGGRGAIPARRSSIAAGRRSFRRCSGSPRSARGSRDEPRGPPAPCSRFWSRRRFACRSQRASNGCRWDAWTGQRPALGDHRRIARAPRGTGRTARRGARAVGGGAAGISAQPARRSDGDRRVVVRGARRGCVDRARARQCRGRAWPVRLGDGGGGRRDGAARAAHRARAKPGGVRARGHRARKPGRRADCVPDLDRAQSLCGGGGDRLADGRADRSRDQRRDARGAVHARRGCCCC